MGRRSLPEPVLGETPVRTRDEASLLGSTVYFTGMLCSNGHLDWRYVSNMACRSCMKPVKPAVRFMGESFYNYKYMLSLQLKMLALPENEDQRRNLLVHVERAAREWAYSWGLAPRPPPQGDDE